MKELYLIMENLLQIEYQQEAFLQILAAAERAYGLSEQQKDMKMLVSFEIWQIEREQRELHRVIGKLDEYIAQNAILRK